MKRVTVDIYVETRKDTFNEADQLSEIIRDMFRKDCGRLLTNWTETQEFEDLANNQKVLNKPDYWTIGDTRYQLDSWGWEEIARDHYAATETFREQGFRADGELQVMWLRFQGDLALRSRYGL